MTSIEDKLKILPESPGVYLMKDENGEIIYVGKAVNLKNRVKQYFQKGNLNTPKTKIMVKKIRDFDFIVTDSEVEALILECNLIKEHRPKYNVLLRDDKNYQYIKITNEEFPRLITTRKIEKDNARYFGPFVSGVNVKQMVNFLRTIFKIRSCKRNLPQEIGKKRPCLNYFINRCSAPCTGNIDSKNYSKSIDDAMKVLNGKGDEIVQELFTQMQEYSDNLEFERAAEIRDRIKWLENIVNKQKVIYKDDRSEDVINYAMDERKICFVVLCIRNGKLINKEEFYFDEKIELEQFLEIYYSQAISLPKEIIIPQKVENVENIETMIEKLYGVVSKLVVAKMGEKKELLEMSKKNAEISLINTQKMMSYYSKILSKLSEKMGINKEIEKIESYDISNIGGADNVASLVVFEDGKFKKEFYRKFKIKSFEGQDDYQSIKEVVERRFSNLEKHGRIPDIIFIDGGIGQVNAAKRVLREFGLNIPVLGMVKDDRHKTKDLIYEGNNLNIVENPELLKLVATIQEETHRFAVKYHRELRRKHLYESILDEVDGIGEKRKAKLFRVFGSIDNLRKATVEEIAKAGGFSVETAKRIKQKLIN